MKNDTSAQSSEPGQGDSPDLGEEILRKLEGLRLKRRKLQVESDDDKSSRVSSE